MAVIKPGDLVHSPSEGTYWLFFDMHDKAGIERHIALLFHGLYGPQGGSIGLSVGRLDAESEERRRADNHLCAVRLLRLRLGAPIRLRYRHSPGGVNLFFRSGLKSFRS